MVLMVVTPVGEICAGSPTLFNSKFRWRKCVIFTLQQDNASIHASRSTKTWLEDNDVTTMAGHRALRT
uniref:DDE_3 domain-containing protein n=1 Tax=Heterorhabditis bacteriophora TaxID=37862 RepID=A0A1I7WT14_HETBA